MRPTGGLIPLSAASRARSYPRALCRIAFVGAAAAAGVALLAVPATAHVSVAPASAQPGSAAVLTFHVPNEESGADTTRVTVQIPTDHPIAQLLVEPVPGWTISVKAVTLAKPLVTDDGQFDQAVSEVDWTGGQIAPGQFQDFSVSADPLPEGVSRLTFKTIQTYSNGDVVRWIDVAQPGQPEPDHPAPVLTLSTGTGTGTVAAPAVTSTAAKTGSDTMARGIAVGGLVCGLGALALAGLSLRRRGPVSVPAETAPVANGAPKSATAPAANDAIPNGGSQAAAARPAPGRNPAQCKTAGSRQDRTRR
jgi:uncharacterized protein